ncbi:MAG: hypothetical protein ISS47_03175 [Candidatus Omnitrophica bacterium]|nr:hypothetical protein [Candidatus Omnitrophota bacterium]
MSLFCLHLGFLAGILCVNRGWIKPLALLLGITIIVFSMCDVCLADWRDSIRDIGQKIRRGRRDEWGKIRKGEGHMGNTVKKLIAGEWVALLLAAVLTLILWIKFPAAETHVTAANPTYIDHAYSALNTRGLLGVAYGALIYGIYILLRVTIGAIRTIKKK